MKLTLENKYYIDENYKTEIFIDGNLVEGTKYDLNGKMEIICKDNTEVTIKISNIILNDKMFGILFFVYWFFTLIGGIGDKYPFGYPCDMILVLNISDGDNIYIKTKDFNEDKPFGCNKKQMVAENRFVISNKVKNRWILGERVPIYLFHLFILFLIIMIDFDKKYIWFKIILICIPIIFMVFCTRKIVRVLKKSKNAESK